MKVVSFLGSVPSRNSNRQKEELLERFAEGVSRVGDEGILHRGHNLVDCDVAVIQGWVYDNISTAHLQLRNDLIRKQKNEKKYVAVADANLFLYKDKTNPFGYLRYSFNGVFPNTGIYCDTEIDTSRWKTISRDTGINLEDYKNKGRHILLLLQRQGGWSMSGLDVQHWAIDTIKQIRKHTDRPIVVRAHPGDKRAKHYLNPRLTLIKDLANVKISQIGTPLENDLAKAHAVVNHNSSAVVGPIIQGYHCFLTDPENSQSAEVSNTDFSMIEHPKEFNRQQWLERISMFHWKFEELSNGKCWSHMRNYCQ